MSMKINKIYKLQNGYPHAKQSLHTCRKKEDSRMVFSFLDQNIVV